MIRVEDAKHLAEEEIKKLDPEKSLILERFSEFEEGWFFYFTSRKYLETQDILDRPIGLGPIIIGKETGVIFQAGSAFGEEYWIEKFKEYITKKD